MSNQDHDPEQSPEIGQEAPAPSNERSTGIIPPSPSSDGENVTTTFGIQPPEQQASIIEPPRFPVVPPDLNVPWSWGDLVVFFLFYFGSTVVLVLVTMIGTAAAIHVSLNDLVSKPSVLVNSLSVVDQAVVSFAAIFYLWVLAQKRSPQTESQSGEGLWQILGWRSLANTAANRNPALRYVAGGVGLALTVSFVSQFVGQRGPVPFEELFKSRQTVLLLMAYGILVAPVVEEMMFRGFIYPVVARHFGIVAGVITTGLLFGAFHAMQLWGAWEQIGLLAIVGIVLALVRARSRSIFASYLIHVSYNSTLFAGLLLATRGLTYFPSAK